MITIESRDMKNITVIRRLEWDAMHRIPGHEGKCAAFHGHRYVLEIAVTGARLDHLGRVIDFSVIRTTLGQWIDSHFDHNAILFKDDPAAASIIPYNLDAGRPVYLLDSMPTVENIASELAKIAMKLLKPFDIDVVSIRVWETQNCPAIWVSPKGFPNSHLRNNDRSKAAES